MPAKLRTAIELLICLAICFLPAVLGGRFMPGAWYASLAKPALNPPGWVFGPVWTVLYALMGILDLRIISTRSSPMKSTMAVEEKTPSAGARILAFIGRLLLAIAIPFIAFFVLYLGFVFLRDSDAPQWLITIIAILWGVGGVAVLYWVFNNLVERIPDVWSRRLLPFVFVRPAMAINAGVVTGDLLFLGLAAGGMAAAARALGDYFDIVRFLCALYLCWQGVVLWRRRPQPLRTDDAQETDFWRNYGAGLLLMLGHVQAKVFYAALLPGFVDLSTLTWRDLGLLALVLVVVIGGVNAGYALLAARARRLLGDEHARRALERAAGSGDRT